MFIPIGDTPNPERFRPYVNWALIATNVLVFLLVTLPLSGTAADPADPLYQAYLEALQRKTQVALNQYDLFVFEHGYKAAAPALDDLLSAMFLHGGFMHLAGNMLFLWIYGDNIEHRIGRFGYLIVYLISGAVATVTYGLFARGSMVPLVGASGAISGALGMYFLMFPKNKVKVFIALFPFYFNVVLLPSRIVLGFYVVVQNILPFVLGSQSNVAYGAHLGGFFAGLGIAFVGERWGWQRPTKLNAPSEPAATARASAAHAPAELTQGLRGAIEAGDRQTAFAFLQRTGAKGVNALPPAQCVLLASWLLEIQQQGAAAEVLRRCITKNRGTASPQVAEAYLMMGELRLAQGQPTSAYQYLLAVFDLEPAPQVEARARDALSRIQVYRR